jgi:hypothetical protein
MIVFESERLGTYLAGRVEVITLTNVDSTVTAGGVDTEIMVEVTFAGAMSVKAHARLAHGLFGRQSRCGGVRNGHSTCINKGLADSGSTSLQDIGAQEEANDSLISD